MFCSKKHHNSNRKYPYQCALNDKWPNAGVSGDGGEGGDNPIADIANRVEKDCQ